MEGSWACLSLLAQSSGGWSGDLGVLISRGLSVYHVEGLSGKLEKTGAHDKAAAASEDRNRQGDKSRAARRAETGNR